MRENININFENAQDNIGLNKYPIECFFQNNYKYRTCSSLHWHFYSEIIYVNEGAQEVTVGNNIVRLNKGELIYINPQQVHLAYSCSNSYTALTVLKFDPTILKSSLESELENKLLMPFLNQVSIQNLYYSKCQIDRTNIKALLKSILEEQNNHQYGYEYALRNKTCEVILNLMRELNKSGNVISNDNGINEKDLDSFYKVMRYINDNFKEEILTSDICKICNLSYSNFAVKFKRLTGKTLTEYINYVRISYAQQMLATTRTSITDIANACGFNDVCYFSRVFKKYLDISPYEFRTKAVLT